MFGKFKAKYRNPGTSKEGYKVLRKAVKTLANRAVRSHPLGVWNNELGVVSLFCLKRTDNRWVGTREFEASTELNEYIITL